MKYFTLSEFDSPDLPGSGDLMHPDFLTRLDLAREKAAVPFRINSGYRTKEWNEYVGGVPDSSHLVGYAADISATTSNRRFIILKALIEVGFTRIGIADSFIHVDSDPNKIQSCVWLY